MVTVQVVIPYAQLDDQRDRLFRYVLDFFAAIEIDVVLGMSTNDNGAASFNHPRAINSAVAKSSAEVIVICDADTVPSGEWMRAIENVGLGVWPWAMPQSYRKLGEAVTQRVLAREIEAFQAGPSECDWVGDAVSWAGFQVVRRESFLSMGGWDERFIGWGSDDACFGLAMDTLVGRHVRFEGNAEHLWHRQTPKDSYLHANWDMQFQLTEQYMAASGNREEMLAIMRGDPSFPYAP